MIGHVSPNDLAAMSLSIALYMIISVGLTGVIYALIPILAQHYGTTYLKGVGQMWGQGVWLALVLSAVGAAVMLFPDLWLSLAGTTTPAVHIITKKYLQALALALPAVLLFQTIYAFSVAVSHTKYVMGIHLGALVFKALFNWLLIYGHWGFPTLGATGAGLSTALVSWISLGLGFWLMTHDPYYRRFLPYIGKPCWASQKQLLSLGLPMGASYLVEECAFDFMTILIAREGVNILGGHQILASIADVCYKVPMAIGVATAALTAQALGNHHYGLARHLGRAGLTLALIAAGLTVVLVWFGAPLILKAYTDYDVLARIVTHLLPMFPLYHVADSLQCMIVYLLRAYKITVAPLFIQAIVLGGVGGAGGWWLGFGPDAGGLDGLRTLLIPLSPVGAGTVWLMGMLSLICTAVFLNGWYWRFTTSASGRIFVDKASPER
jgi:MATE family multidrug resistance protein